MTESVSNAAETVQYSQEEVEAAVRAENEAHTQNSLSYFQNRAVLQTVELQRAHAEIEDLKQQLAALTEASFVDEQAAGS